MNQIELENWEQSTDNPQKLIYAGQRTAQEVFAEIKHRLESVGMLPDEYFDIDSQWENGSEIPKNAHIFGTVMYGESEGIYLDIGIRWDEEGKRHMTTFATGKTLGESESHLDRMYLTASAINKALYSNEPHARYIKIGGEDKTLENSVLHLNSAERQLLIDSLIAIRNNQPQDINAVEQLLRRVAGSITEFVNEVGARPLQVSDYDMTVLAIQDGNIAVFNEVYKKAPDRMDDLLICAAARPGKVGYNMTATLLQEAKGISNEAYLDACKKAVDIGSMAKVLLLADKAAECVADLDMSLYGKIISEAIGEHNPIARALVKQYTSEQIQAANPYILAQALFARDTQLAFAMAEKKIDVTHNASDVIRALRYHSNDDWMLKLLYDRGMEMNPKNIPAMLTCIDVKSVEMGQVLIDRGMNFEQFEQFAINNHNICLTSETFIALKQYSDKAKEPEKPKTLEEKLSAAKEKAKGQDDNNGKNKSRKRDERE